VCGCITAFNLSVATAFTSMEDIKIRAYPRLCAGFVAQVTLGIPLYLLGPPVIVVGALAMLMVSSCIFFALSVSLIIGALSAFQTSYSTTGSSSPMRSSFPSSEHAFSLAATGEHVNVENQNQEQPEQGEVLIPQSASFLQLMMNSAPAAMFQKYPILLLALVVTPTLSSVLTLLLLTSPYWSVWWYVTTPAFIGGFLFLEVSLVTLYWSRILSQNVYTRVSSISRRVYNFCCSTVRTLYMFAKEKWNAFWESYQLHQKTRQRERQMKYVAAAQPAQPYHIGQSQSVGQPQSATPTDEDTSNNGSSTVSPLNSSRRSSHNGIEGETQNSLEMTIHTTEEEKSKSKKGKKKN